MWQRESRRSGEGRKKEHAPFFFPSPYRRLKKKKERLIAGYNFQRKASDTGNIRGMYEDIKQATGKATKKTAPLKSKTGEVDTGQDKQMAR